MNIRFIVPMVMFAAAAAAAGWVALAPVDDPAVERTGTAHSVPPARRPLHQAIVHDEGASATPASPPSPELNDGRLQVRDWPRRYDESQDDFALAGELVAAALDGDGAAQHQLGRLLLRCEVYKRILAPYASGSVAERVEFHLASGTLAEQARSQFRRGALRCERLFTEDPFAGYELPEDAKDFRYWAHQAEESGDPVALVNRVLDRVMGPGRTDADAERELRDDLRRVVFSGNGAALYALGGIFSHRSVVSDPDNGYAWIVVACESGYDCSNANPEIGVGCVERGSCDRGSTFLDVMQRDLGPGKYAAIYAKAQDIQYRIRANDWDGLQQYLETK